MTESQPQLKAGQKVRILQTIARREGPWQCETVGVITEILVQKTGSWYAHAQDDKLWLQRIRLQKENGEITTVSVDQHTQVEVLAAAPSS